MPGAPPFCSTRLRAPFRFLRFQRRPHSDSPSALDSSLSCAGDGSTLGRGSAGFTRSSPPAATLSGSFCFACSSRVRFKSCPPSRSALPVLTATVLWPLLTPVASIHLHRWDCLIARRQVSPGKNADCPCALAAFTPSAFDCCGLHGHLPTRPTDEASYAVRVPPAAGLPPASSRLRLAVTPLPLANGWCNQPP
jgi:hypothetical protein